MTYFLTYLTSVNIFIYMPRSSKVITLDILKQLWNDFLLANYNTTLNIQWPQPL